jgi:hypothetical protein
MLPPTLLVPLLAPPLPLTLLPELPLRRTEAADETEQVAASLLAADEEAPDDGVLYML